MKQLLHQYILQNVNNILNPPHYRGMKPLLQQYILQTFNNMYNSPLQGTNPHLCNYVLQYHLSD